MPADGVSYNPTPFEADGGPNGSSKLQNGRLQQRSKKNEKKTCRRRTEERQKSEWQNTLKVSPRRRPLPGLQLLTGSNAGFGPVNHLLGAPELPVPDGRPSQ